MYNSTSKVCKLLDSSTRTCWGVSGPKDPAIEECHLCSSEIQPFEPSEVVYLQPNEDFPETFGSCAGSVEWNLTAGNDGAEVWRQDNLCGGLALSEEQYQDVEFRGSFAPLDNDDDWFGFVFGYEDPGHFYLVLAPKESHSGTEIKSNFSIKIKF